MSGESDLGALLRTMTPRLIDGVYVFATIGDRPTPPGLRPRMRFEEAEGATLVVLRDEAERHGLDYAFPCRMITLDVHSSLDAVGFIARIATALAEAEMGVNPVSGFYHDHLFVPLGREVDAMALLSAFASED